MKEPNWKSCTEEELWRYVATHLASNGIDTILVGGAVVSIYTEGAYRSGGLDFVLLNFLSTKLPELMKAIGFQVKDGRHYKHPKCKHLFVEFCSGPAGIGEDHQIQPAEIRNEGKLVKIFSQPTVSATALHPLSTSMPKSVCTKELWLLSVTNLTSTK